MAYGPGQAYPPQPQLPPGPAGQDAAGVWYAGPGPAGAGPVSTGPVSTGPVSAGVNPSWLAASADRERAVGVLRAGFTEGRLTRDELDDRVARAYAARTYADLWALTADLPAGALPYPQAPPCQHAVMPHRAEPPGTWRSATALILTALVIFTIAALLTAIATAHAQPGPFPGFQQVPQKVQLLPAQVQAPPPPPAQAKPPQPVPLQQP